jgi:hypothetical protein
MPGNFTKRRRFGADGQFDSLCAEKDGAVAKYALEGLPNKVLAAEYRTALPKERLLIDEIKRTRIQLEVRRHLTASQSKGWKWRVNH